jgi:hypothetical protein
MHPLILITAIPMLKKQINPAPHNSIVPKLPFRKKKSSKYPIGMARYISTATIPTVLYLIEAFMAAF